jgi:hypothetical protein
MNLHTINAPVVEDEDEEEDTDRLSCDCGSDRFERRTYWTYTEPETYQIGDQYTEYRNADNHEYNDADPWECARCGAPASGAVVDHISDMT